VLVVGFVSKVPCSPRRGDEQASKKRSGISKSNSRCSNNASVSVAITLEELVDRSLLLQDAGTPRRHSSNILRKHVCDAFSLTDTLTAAAKHLERIEADLQSCADAIDEAVFDCFDITDYQRETVLQEIALRTIEDPREREEYDPESITEPGDDFPEMVKDLLLHLAIRTVHEDDDGIVPLSDVDGEDGLLSRIEDEFDRLFSEHASARLAEVDQILGSRTADEEAYPNLREWLEDDLFDYHVSTFDRTPILWRLTTERLVSDPEGEGFACLVDYHQLDAGVFDRLQNRYLEPRKALLRERRSAANRRRGDDSLSASEKAAAAEEYARSESGLEQIDVFEERLSELAQSSPREWPEANQQTAEEAVETVADFREETASRLETLEELAAIDDVDMGDLFSPSFYETVQKNQDEWLDALDDLESAFEAYAADGSEPVEAHLYDLFRVLRRSRRVHALREQWHPVHDVLLREVRRRRTVPDRGHRGVGAPASPLRVSHWPRFVREARERGLRNL